MNSVQSQRKSSFFRIKCLFKETSSTKEFYKFIISDNKYINLVIQRFLVRHVLAQNRESKTRLNLFFIVENPRISTKPTLKSLNRLYQMTHH